MERGKTKTKEGVVVSDKMTKTVVVRVERVYRHPVYHKVMKIAKKFKAHDEKGEYKVGDRVEIMECRPLSADKCWRVVRRISLDSKS
ncbi:MAG: 30S ribosomal protein S17 [Candidatus Margulisbacteria bacterium]|nr:30S ribosomal protein S17 [Candidatus Margulisiibacteriota bacterium]